MSASPILDANFVAASLAGVITSHAGPNARFSRAVIDSREARQGDLFVALPGEHADGHTYAADAVRRGASGALLARPLELGADAATFVVPDVLGALQRLAVAWRNELSDLEVVGVTGNVGKSTTKLITAALLESRYRVQAETHNYNNEIGVPLCLLDLRPDTERAVIEMGMYTTGEIAVLCTWARPRIGIVLNVGPVHLERAGSLDAIAQAKRELPEALPADGHAILNIDDERVRAMAPFTRARVWTVGTAPDAAVRGDAIESHGAEGFEFTLHYRDASRRLHVPLAGAHLVTNVLAGVATAIADGIGLDEVCEAVEDLDVPTRVVVRRSERGFTVLDDTYNASPAATLAALELLSETPGRRIALLGDMLELGEVSAEEHARVGRRAAEVVDSLYTVGKLGRGISAAATAAGLARVRHFNSKQAATEALDDELRPGDVLLVKASRGLALETVVTALVGSPANASAPEVASR
ncbi:MAG: UDP-N-acetylmuramoyl-tripeptide--D-alanyl-D-alanine ligase [Dehalococcoidia bacterium]